MRTNHCLCLAPLFAGAALASCTTEPPSVATKFEVTPVAPPCDAAALLIDDLRVE